MTISLPDVNVWIALAAEGHIHHHAARNWFTAQPSDSIAFCRITQMGLLRLLTNPSVMGRSPKTIVQAWDIFGQLRSDRRSVYAAEPGGVDSTWRRFMTQPGIGPSSWTDSYIAAFAQTLSYSLVTFDAAFERWVDLQLKLLNAGL